MRVIHVIPSVAQRDGGPSTVSRELAKRLVSGEVEVRLVTTDKGLESGARLPASTTLVRSYPPDRLTFAPRIGPALRTAVQDASMVHVHGLYNYVSAMALRVSRGANVPYILQPHGVLDEYHTEQRQLIKRGWARLFEPRALEDAVAVIASSDREEEGILARAAGAHVVRLPLGVDTLLFKRHGRVSGSRMFLFLGRLAEKKGLDLLLLAVTDERVRTLGVEFVIAGPVHYDLPTKVRHALNEAHAAGLVRLVGSVGPQERRELLAKARAFLLPSKDESFGVAAAEALAAGVPVITSPHVGIAPEVARAGAGVVVPLDVDAVVNAIVSLAEDDARLEEMSEAARALANREYNWDSVCARYISICTEVLG